MTETMQRWSMNALGRENLKLTQAPVPQPGPGEVRVRVNAVALNYRDKMVIEGSMPIALSLLDADAESAPEARQRNFALLELLLKLEELTLKDAARRDTAGLLRHPGANLAIARTAVEIFNHFQR